MTRARRSIYTPKNINSAFAATGIWLYNPRRVLSWASPKITCSVSAYISLHADSKSATRQNSRAINCLQRSAMHPFKRNTPCSLKLKHIIGQLGRCVEGAIADRDLEGEMPRNLHSQAKDLSAASTKDHCQLTKARVITQEDVVHLREETEQKEAKKSASAEAWKRKQTATASSKEIEGLSATSNQEKQHSMVKCAGTNLQKAGSDEEEDLVDEQLVAKGESEGEEDSLIPDGGLLKDMQAGDDGEVAGMVGRKVEIVTRPGSRAGRVIYS